MITYPPRLPCITRRGTWPRDSGAAQWCFTVARVGCQAAAAFAKHLVWSRDCSARLFVAWSKPLSGAGRPPSLLCKSPRLPLAATGMGAGLGSSPEKAACERRGSPPAATIKQRGCSCCCFPKPFSVAAVGCFPSLLLPFPLAPSPPPALASVKILSMPGRPSLSSSFLHTFSS